MIHYTTIESAMYEATRLAATIVPPDVEIALDRVLAEETEPLAKMHLEVSKENFRLAAEGKGLVCGDTGFPLFFVKAGSGTELEDGFETLWRAARAATARATADNFLRPTMVDPLTRVNSGDNVGSGMPKVELLFQGDSDDLEIIAVPKGGGSEIFGTYYKMLFPCDGMEGVTKFVLDCIRESCYAGKICPPAIVGIGIGGSSDLCMRLAKEAALLRPVGESNPEPAIAEIETKLLHATRQMGIGPMGASGINAVMAVHVKTAVTHTAALPVAVNAQCLVGRRWKAYISANETTTFTGDV